MSRSGATNLQYISTTKTQLKIPKEELNAITEGQTTQWPKEKKTCTQTAISKTLNRKLKIKHHEPHYQLRCSGRVSGSCSTGGTRGVTLVTNPVIPLSHKKVTCFRHDIADTLLI